MKFSYKSTTSACLIRTLLGSAITTVLYLVPSNVLADSPSEQQHIGSSPDHQAQPVSVELVVDSATVGSGAVISPGVRFLIPKNWHIYAQTPGGIGLPTKVKYTVPPGFNLGEIYWPPHKSFDQPGGLIGYGYEGEVTLSAPVQIPDKLPPGEKFAIEAEVRWLSCYDRCIPGHAKLSREFTIAQQ